jgi:hypothetical protein
MDYLCLEELRIPLKDKEANKEYARAYMAKWRKENKERVRANHIKWRKNNPHKSRVYQLKRDYNLTSEEYSALLEEQQGVCAICCQADSTGKQLSVDHDHTTGKVRGLLCSGCNLALGSVKENITILENMMAYIRKHENG